MKLFDRPDSAASCETLFDSLEPRLAFYAPIFLADFPELSAMASSQNTVVRMQTSVGNIDIELFDRAGPDGAAATAAPNTAANFINYISDGRLDDTFFHRMAEFIQGETSIVQGGGFRFNPAAPSGERAVSVPTFAPIENEFNQARGNAERTIAMARLGGQPNSATSQFYFNVVDNANLDTIDGGFTVFGRVIQGWEVIEHIAGLNKSNLNSVLGTAIGAFGEVPVTQQVTGAELTADHLITIIDIDVIKPAQTSSFYTHSLYFPDGFRSGRTTAVIDLVNLDAGEVARYEIIARFEVESRDKVIASGALTPGAQLSVPIYTAGDPSVDKIRPGTPFAFEIRATKPVAAAINHSDFGATATQSFINARQFLADDLLLWNFAFGQKGVPSFLVWQNLSHQEAQLTVTFTSETGDSHSIIQLLGGFRRGGLNVNLLDGVPTGAYSVTIESTRPIVAALSQYRAAPARATIETTPIGGPMTQGILPGAIISSDGQSVLSVAVAQAPAEPVIVDFEFILADGTVLTRSSLFTLTAENMRDDTDLSVAHGLLPADEYFTIRYRVVDGGSGAVPISASYLALAQNQMMRSAFQTASSQEVYFAGGYTNPESASSATEGEFISIYNPHMDPGVQVTYRLRFHFTEGPGDELIFPGGLGTGTIGAGQTVHIPVRQLAGVMERINSGSQFHVYGITVSTDIRRNGEEIPGAIFAQYTRIDADGRSATTGPTLGNDPRFPTFFLNNPLFG